MAARNGNPGALADILTEVDILFRALALAVKEGEISLSDARRVLSWVPWESQRREYGEKLNAAVERAYLRV